MIKVKYILLLTAFAILGCGEEHQDRPMAAADLTTVSIKGVPWQNIGSNTQVHALIFQRGVDQPIVNIHLESDQTNQLRIPRDIQVRAAVAVFRAGTLTSAPAVGDFADPAKITFSSEICAGDQGEEQREYSYVGVNGFELEVTTFNVSCLSLADDEGRALFFNYN